MKAKTHCDLDVYKRAFAAAMAIFRLSKTFPKEEKYSLTDQIRRSSRSVCANLAEAWWKRRYEAAFINKLSDCQAEAAETQAWLEIAVDCGYLDPEVARPIYGEYLGILNTLTAMTMHVESWLLPRTGKKTSESE
jgi:four helix bundle protein